MVITDVVISSVNTIAWPRALLNGVTRSNVTTTLAMMTVNGVVPLSVAGRNWLWTCCALDLNTARNDGYVLT